MATLYVDTDGSGASTPFNSWATAAQDLETALEDAACVAGSTIYMQGAAADSKAAYTLTSAGTSVAPVLIVGCINDTNNAGANIVTADLADRITDNMPQVATSSGNLTFAGVLSFSGIDLQPAGTFAWNSDAVTIFTNCKVQAGSGALIVGGNPAGMIGIDSEVIAAAISASGNASFLYLYGGIATTTQSFSFNSGAGHLEVIGVDCSASSSTAVFSRYGSRSRVVARNCKLWTGAVLMASSWNASPNTGYNAYALMIGCSDATTKANAESYQDYNFENRAGTCVNEGTILRTGGATDGALGAFSYALENNASYAIPAGIDDGTYTPWLSVWVAGGASKTFTIYTTHDNAGTINRDLYENELWAEFYTPDASDSAGYDQTMVPNLGRYVPGSTVASGTDDTGSTWVTHNTYKRTFAVTVTPGYTGFAYARVKLRYNSATPVTVYVDPLIVVT